MTGTEFPCILLRKVFFISFDLFIEREFQLTFPPCRWQSAEPRRTLPAPALGSSLRTALTSLSLKPIKVAIAVDGNDRPVNNHAEKAEVLTNISVLSLGEGQMLCSDQTIMMSKYFPFQ